MGMLQDGRVSTGVSKVLDSDSGLQLSMKANSILGGNTWAQRDAEFLKLDSKGMRSVNLHRVATGYLNRLAI